MKKLLVLLVVVFMLLCYVGCSAHDGVRGNIGTTHECVGGDWVVTKDATYLESGENTRFCIECNEIVEVDTFELDSYVSDQAFVFSPNEFAAKLDKYLADTDREYRASVEIRAEDNVVTVCIFRDSKTSGVCQIIFSIGDENFTGKSSKTKTGATFLMTFFDSSCSENELTSILPAILKAVNSLMSTDSAQTLTEKIIEKSEDAGIRENEILYRLIDTSSIMDSKWLFITSLED